MPAEFLKLRNARHGAVRIHNFADHTGGDQACRPGEIDGSLGLSGSHQHAAFPGAERKHVARPCQVRRPSCWIDSSQDGAGPVGGRNPGGNAFARIDGLTESGTKVGRILR